MKPKAKIEQNWAVIESFPQRTYACEMKETPIDLEMWRPYYKIGDKNRVATWSSLKVEPVSCSTLYLECTQSRANKGTIH